MVALQKLQILVVFSRVIIFIPILLDLYETVWEFSFVCGFWKVFDKF